MNIVKSIQQIIPDSSWKSRINYQNMTVCYSGKCQDYHLKIVEGFDNRYDLKVKSNTNTFTSTYLDPNELIEQLPMVLNVLDK